LNKKFIKKVYFSILKYYVNMVMEEDYDKKLFVNKIKINSMYLRNRKNSMSKTKLKVQKLQNDLGTEILNV